MNYLEIILRGYYNENDRKFFSTYFIRECEKSKKEHYDLEEFFNGLTSSIELLKSKIQDRLSERQHKLYLLQDIGNEKHIEYCENELSTLSFEKFPINLLHLTDDRFRGNLYHSEVLFIDEKINEAQKELKQLQHNESVKSCKLIKNESETIFKNDIGFTIFTKMFEIYKGDKNILANFSFLFYAMEKDFLVCTQTEFKVFLRDEKYSIEIEKIDNRQWFFDMNKNKKSKLYNSMKESLQEKHGKSTI